MGKKLPHPTKRLDLNPRPRLVRSNTADGDFYFSFLESSKNPFPKNIPGKVGFSSSWSLSTKFSAFCKISAANGINWFREKMELTGSERNSRQNVQRSGREKPAGDFKMKLFRRSNFLDESHD